MTTGSDGLHVALSIKREEKFDKVKEKASKIASSLVKRLPEIYTTEIRQNKKLILGGLRWRGGLRCATMRRTG